MPSQGPGPDYQVPSIELYRPVINMDGSDIDRFKSAVDEFTAGSPLKMAVSGVQYPGSLDPRVSLISAGEMLSFHEQHELPLDRGSAGLLKDYLKKNVPEAMNDAVEVPALPMSVHHSRDAAGRTLAFMALGAGAQPLEERRTAQCLVHRYYDLPESDEALGTSWQENELSVRLPIARVSGDPARVTAALRVVKKVLDEQAGIFPENLTYGPVKRDRKGIYRKRQKS